MALSFQPACFDELLGLLLTADRETRLRVHGNLALLEEFGPELVVLFELGGDPPLHELRVDTDPVFGLVCAVRGGEALALAAYFDHGSARSESLINAKARYGS